MALDSKQLQVIDEYFGNKIGHIPHCHVCSVKEKMEIFPNILDVPISEHDPEHGKYIPMIALICPICHNFKLFAAGEMSIIQ